MNCGHFLIFVWLSRLSHVYSDTLYIADPSNQQNVNSTNAYLKLNNGSTYVSVPIDFKSEVPVGHKLYSTAFVLTNGIIYFSEDTTVRLSGSPDLQFAYSKNQSLLAPFWADILPDEGQVSYNIYEHCGTVSGAPPTGQSNSVNDQVMSRARQDVIRYHGLPDFDVDSVLVVTWSQVKPFSNFSKLGQIEQNTFQAVFISGWIKYHQGILSEEKTSYVLYIYRQGEMIWNYVPGRIINIGYSGDDVIQLPNMDSPYVSMLGTVTGNTGTIGVWSFLVGHVISQAEKCQRYLCNHRQLLDDTNFKNESKNLIQCPCSIDKMGFEWELFQKQGTNQEIHCYIISQVAKTKLLKGTQRNRLCCYKMSNEQDWQLKLKNSLYIGGHMLSRDPWLGTEALDNILAHDACCHNAPKSKCDQFYSIFQNNDCSSQHRFSNAYGFGDPHIITFDGLTYSMNGWGEFILLEVDRDEFSLQARTERAFKVNYGPVNATIFIGFAAQEKNYSHFQVEISPSGTSMNIYVNGKNFTENFYREPNFLFSNNNISVLRQVRGKDFVTAKFPCGVALTVNVGIKNLELEVKVGDHLNKKAVGLLGFYSGNTSDDFRDPDGSSIHSANDMIVYASFIKYWAASSANSIFKYFNGDSSANYTHPRFTPLFSNQVITNQIDMSFCQMDKLCMFDYFITHDRNLAENSRILHNRYKSLAADLVNHPPILHISNLNANGLWVVNHGELSVLNVQTNVRLELIEDNSGANITIINHQLHYTPDVNKPVVLRLRAVDDHNISSEIVTINVGVCSDCKRRGTCAPTKTDDLTYINGHFWRLKCTCDSLFAGAYCDKFQGPCEIHPCSLGQNCTELSTSLNYTCGPCPSGYEALQGKCVDVNECLNNTTCGENICVNVMGSYTCDCKIGFKYDQDSKTCMDINECNIKTSFCQHFCTNTPGGFECSCHPGYTLNNDNKTCSLNSSYTLQCNPCQHICNLETNVTCDCFNGYILDVNSYGKCNDINECTSHNYTCSQVCHNKDGYYTCSCQDGFILNVDNHSCEVCHFPYYGKDCLQQCNCNGHGTCNSTTGCVCDKNWSGPNCETDVDECLIVNTCPDGQICNNTIGSYKCSCPVGTQLIDGRCQACTENFYGLSCALHCSCLTHQKCNKVDGTCSCMDGWTGQACDIDVDECVQEAQICNSTSHEICVNVLGGYFCVCGEGFGLIDLSKEKVCQECQDGKYGINCTSSCSCHDINTKYCDKVNGTCFCKDGWEGPHCSVDTDECKKNPDLCNMTNHEFCNNTQGSYICACQAGLHKDNGEICIECNNGTFGPDCQHQCTCQLSNTRYCDKKNGTCYCITGWTGENCDTDINECAENTHNCSVSNHEECKNKKGSFNCSCQNGFVLDHDGKTCKDINLCDMNNCSWGCEETDNNSSFHCICPIGQYLSKDNISCKDCQNWTFGENCISICSCDLDHTSFCDKIVGTCNCNGGWEGQDCKTDINECKENPNPCNRTNHELCTNTFGSYVCSCEDGFHKDKGDICIECQNGRFGANCSGHCICEHDHTTQCDKINGTCFCKDGWEGTGCRVDTNECMADPNPCNITNNELCNNFDGSYHCSCNAGFHKDGGNTCIACSDGTYGYNCSKTCNCNASTTNVCNKISGQCSCLPGWYGSDCSLDIDECVVHEDSCDISRHELCVNTLGSFKCSCELGYCLDVDGKTCVVSLLNLCGKNCTWGCKETDRNSSFDCICPIGQHLSFDNITCEEAYSSDVVQLNLRFDYEGILDLNKDEKTIKSDIESLFLRKLQEKYDAVEKIHVHSLRKGSLIVDCDITLKNKDNNLNFSIDRLAQALHQIEKEKDSFLINNQPAVLSEVTLKGFKVDKSTSVCDVKEMFDPCEVTKSCQEQGMEAVCVSIVKKDHLNFIIGMSVGLSGFALLCAFISILTIFLVRKKLTSEEKKKKIPSQETKLNTNKRSVTTNKSSAQHNYTSTHRSGEKPNVNQSNKWSSINKSNPIQYSSEKLTKAIDSQVSGVYPSHYAATKFQNENANQTELREFHTKESISPVYTVPTPGYARLNNARNYHRDSMWQIYEDKEETGPITRQMSSVHQTRDYYRANRSENMGLNDVETNNKFQSLTDWDNFHITKNQKPLESQYNRRPVESQYNQRPVEAQYNQRPVESQYNRRPVESQYNQRPVASQYNQRPVESQNNQRPEESQYNQRPVESQNNQRPEESQYNQRPVESLYNQRPVELPYDKKSEPLKSRRYSRDPYLHY